MDTLKLHEKLVSRATEAVHEYSREHGLDITFAETSVRVGMKAVWMYDMLLILQEVQEYADGKKGGPGYVLRRVEELLARLGDEE